MKFWEPNAPSFEERFESLKYAYKQGFKTSVSIEPFLDENHYILVDKLLPFVSESIWIGKMNYEPFNSREDSEKKYYELFRKVNSKENLERIVQKARSYKNKRIRIKASVYNYLNIYDLSI